MKVKTDLNTAVEFQIVLNTGVAVTRIEVLSFADSGSSHIGNFSTTDLAQLKIRYTPHLGFRGGEDLFINLYDTYTNKTTIDLHVSVATHWTICNRHLPFAESAAFSATLNWVMGQRNTITISKAALPIPIESAISLSSFSDYIKSQLAIAADAVTKTTQVVEKKSVYIGAPTTAQLASAFHVQTGDRFKYDQDNSDSFELSGIQDQKTFISNRRVLSCEGDLFLTGPVYFENLHGHSKTGCRIYVNDSVFAAGPIVFDNTDDSRNLQITNSKSINLGLGEVTNAGSFCDPYDQANASNSNFSSGSTLLARYRDMWTLGSHVVRENLDPVNNGASIIGEANLIEGTRGTFKDASCRPEVRNVSFERIHLNAPVVQSRYMGRFSGTIIAEYTIMSLSTFKFTYDHVFDNVPIIPFLDSKTYLNVED